MKRGTIIFDFDGTIADSFEFVSGFIAGHGGKADLTPAERRQHFAGLSMRGMADELHIPRWRGAWLFFHGRRVMTEELNQVQPFAGIESVVRELHEQGYTLFALSSNRSETIRLFLQRHDLMQYFSAIQGSASLLGKTLALRLLLWRHEHRSADCFYVGDEVGDLRAAHRLHVRAVAVSWGYNSIPALAAEKPLGVAEKPGDILKIIQSTAEQ